MSETQSIIKRSTDDDRRRCRCRRTLFRMVVLIILSAHNSNGFQQPNQMMISYQHDLTTKNKRIGFQRCSSQNNHSQKLSLYYSTKRPYSSTITRSALSDPRNVDSSLVYRRRKNLREAIASTSTTSSTSNIQPTSSSTTSTNENNNASGPLGFLIGVTVIVVLGLSTSDPSFYGFSIDQSVEELNEVAFATATNIIDASVPTSSSDYFAIALGESIGGVIGATLSVLINFILQMNMNNNNSNTNEEGDQKKDMPTMSKPFVSQALADSDYFIANSATYTLLEAVGVPPEIAKLSSVFIAAIPSQLVKLGPVLQERRSQEEMILQQLLEEEKQNQETLSKSRSINTFGPFRFSSSTPKRENVVTTVDPSELIPVVAGGIEIDFVEVFADVTRWLEYDVLKTEYAGSLQWNNEILGPSMTGAVLGLLAAVSSRLYADVFHAFGYGPVYKQEEVRSRNNVQWLAVYFSTAASAATLFGFYELSAGPISRYIQGTLAGGVEGCVGSSSFEACLQTYIDTNAPGPSPEAQFRALATNFYMVGLRLQDIAVDTTFDDIVALGRAWSVSFVSYLNHALPSY